MATNVGAVLAQAARAHPGARPQAVSRKRKGIALVIAATADLIQLGYFPVFSEGALSPVADMLDAIVLLALVLTLGFHWRLVLSLALELVPGATLFPTWTSVVLSLPTLSPSTKASGTPPTV